MDKLRILIAGCGDVGSALAHCLKDTHDIFALRRSEQDYTNSIRPIKADLLNPNSLAVLPDVDIVVYCLAPSSQDKTKSVEQKYQETYIDGFKNLMSALPNTPKRVFFTSSTSVYGQNNHQWVNEESVTEPASIKGQLMLKAEQQVLNGDAPATVVRFSGIYAANRIHLLNQVKQGILHPAEPVSYSNRIHRDDCALVLAHLINLVHHNKPIDTLYLASDDLPIPIAQVCEFLAAQINSNAANTAPTKPRATASKRCDNSRLKASGFSFQYPDFRAGYTAILQQLATNG